MLKLLSVATLKNVATVEFEMGKDGWEQPILLQSDEHFDSVNSNRALEEQHLKEALATNAYILKFGDLFDAMQGKYDPRRDYSELRPEYKGTQYLDLISKDAKKRYLPYAKNILLFGHGNHETAVARICNTDLTERLVDSLRDNGSPCVKGFYGGWVRFLFRSPSMTFQVGLRYFHGKGTNAPVSRGVMDTNRQSVYMPDADIIVNGHNHQNYILAIARERMSTKGVTSFDNVLHIRIPGYKNDYNDGAEGWAVEKAFGPAPLGAVWLRFFEVSRSSPSLRRKIGFDARLALGQ